MALKEIKLVVSHPSTGMFVARTITDPEKLKDNTYIDRTVNTLTSTLERKGLKGVAVLCQRIEE